MTDRDAREKSGERAMFAKYQHSGNGRTFYSFTPSSVQFWGTLILTLVALVGGIWQAAGVFLRPEIKVWVQEDFGAQLSRMNTFATKEELSSLNYSTERKERDDRLREDALRQELLYMRQRLDAIADRVGAR